MNVYTGMAIDAFRKQEQARRRLVKAENEAHKAVLRVPREEFDLYVAHTELIRFEMDKKDAIAHKDHDAAADCDELIVKMRAEIRDLEARVPGNI